MKSFSPSLLMKTQYSETDFLHLWLFIKKSNFLYNCFGICFNPYKLFFSLHKSFSFPLTSNLFSCSMETVSSRSLYKKVIFKSCCSIFKFKLAIKLKTVLIEDILTIREKISSMSIHLFWPNLSQLTLLSILVLDYSTHIWSCRLTCSSIVSPSWKEQPIDMYGSHAGNLSLLAWPSIIDSCPYK